MSQAGPENGREQREAVALRHIRDAIRGMRYGVITVFVQDGVVIQVNKTEKLRIDYSRDRMHECGDGI